MGSWKIIGIAATLIIVVAIPTYVFREIYGAGTGDPSTGRAEAVFVGSLKCADCHKQAYDRWKNSHHDKAMETATDQTVLGDFNDAVFIHFGATSRFYRKNNRFFVHTPGPGGKPQEFEVTHTFGFFPLQQYLVPFPGGRLQCLPLAWDDRAKKWYHLYPHTPPDPGDWLYWTNAGQNWNGMCAECHSTNLKKNYDMQADSYQTTWTDIDVGCEACHGPGSEHVRWAEMPEMGRPPTANYELAVKTSAMTSKSQVELCAPCHSRRMSLGDNTHDSKTFMDYGVPQLLAPGMYFADGQILEEVYVYGSFTQSKMYDREVRCSDCHDVHSAKRIKGANALCLQCHRADIYDSKAHHFHKKTGEEGAPIKSGDGKILFEVGTGALCEQCHMPGRHYMGIDYRPDHSFRLPRPDLSSALGVPNACNRCHADKSSKWAQEQMVKWYGQKVKPHYGTILDAGRRALPEARDNLIKLSRDRLFPTIMRATALSLLRAYSGKEVNDAIESALADEEALLRHSAVLQTTGMAAARRAKLLAPLLYDPVKAVRIESARSLAAISGELITSEQRAKLDTVVGEYKQAMAYTADFAASRHNLGNLYMDTGQLEAAEKQYLAAIGIDDQFYPAKVNLAMLYDRQGKKDQAERLLREVVSEHPGMHEAQYSLGLLLAERKKYDEASLYLSMAARGIPDRPRVHYNLGLLMDYLGKDVEAEAALTRAVEIDPDSIDFLNALAQYYLKHSRYDMAEPIARQLAEKYPSQGLGARMLDFVAKRKAAQQRASDHKE